ncbi:MAG TPA: AtpZ/AtpI family protein [Candidatus Binatia bacterium]|nr:AtpZ/AtpI family protein [Candidatus Binatia bacterium]
MARRQLRDEVALRLQRISKGARERHGLLANTIFLGTLGLMLVLPIVAGAYLGSWLDRHAAGFSVQWTIECILLGVLIGAMNVFLLIWRH